MLKRAVARVERDLLLAAKRITQGIAPVQRGAGGPRVAFVAGVQRSGTNMLMDVLEQSFRTDVIHERDRRAFERYQMRDLDVIRTLVDDSRAVNFVIKALCELQRLPELLDAFAPAKAVWLVRNYHDVVNSMRVSFGNQAKQVQRIAHDRDSDGWQGEGMSDATHATVRRVVHPGISDTSAAALIWWFRNQLYFDHGFATDPRVMLVRYESLVTEPVAEFRRIFGFLDIPYSPRHSRKVVPTSIRQAALPDIEPSILELCDELMNRFDSLRPVGGSVQQ